MSLPAYQGSTAGTRTAHRATSWRSLTPPSRHRPSPEPWSRRAPTSSPSVSRVTHSRTSTWSSWTRTWRPRGDEHERTAHQGGCPEGAAGRPSQPNHPRGGCHLPARLSHSAAGCHLPCAELIGTHLEPATPDDVHARHPG